MPIVITVLIINKRQLWLTANKAAGKFVKVTFLTKEITPPF